jgi:hypothetical protein
MHSPSSGGLQGALRLPTCLFAWCGRRTHITLATPTASETELYTCQANSEQRSQCHLCSHREHLMVRVLRIDAERKLRPSRTAGRLQPTPDKCGARKNVRLNSSTQSAARRAGSPLAIGQGGPSWCCAAAHRSGLAVMTVERKVKA